MYTGRKGVKDPVFSDEVSSTEDSPDNKGIDDPVFGAYWYDYSYKKSKTKDDSNKKSNTEDSSTNKGVNDPEFGAYWYDYSYKKSKTGDSGKNSNTENSPTKEVRDDPKEYTPINKNVNRKALGGQSKQENTATNETIYFLEETLFPGTKVNLPRLLEKRDMTTFLPQQTADSLPMSDDKLLPEILKNFSLKAESKGTGYVKIALTNCARDEMRGETKYCASSLESFVDLAVSLFGENIRLIWHELGDETKNPSFTIGKVRKIGENDIVCHKMKYPYAVYLCHAIEKTVVYKVPLASDDGTKANVVAVCHLDTSAWSPNHMAFRTLKVKPGTVPVCHFLARDTLVWVPN
ncbi:putative BURP domain-containing protein [Hibiscus syriacus]|uniref:BURP domain-containing protein n=1 Tax=Hibiscus syriacus TaxID=106335 RepID=A0A6A2Y4F8_HIBSY|nr:BURP domain protein RD22-like [Hibiscus syriacus]KAE8678860.1 putative BURP domain-containing protein [Hibiscus syriacus]